MPIANTPLHYGGVAKTLHWLTALLILAAFPLGLAANALPQGSGAEIEAKAALFSLHKTVGIAAFVTAAVRILWALTQPRPAALYPGRRVETFFAEAVHWALYASLVAVPLAGWLGHAASEGFAPILWPFGQSLPLVPKDPDLVRTFAALHWLFTKVMAAAVLLHVAGALKHALWDRDATLRRMWLGTVALPDLAPRRRRRAPLVLAALIWLAAVGAGLWLGRGPEEQAERRLDAAGSEWRVTEGRLGFTVRQMGVLVEGSFADWTADIAFVPETGSGEVEVTVAIASLSLGAVTAEALGADFFDAAAHPTATFAATIRPGESAYLAEGTLTLKGAEVAVSLPFTLDISGDVARMEGSVTLDRRGFGIGRGVSDESQVGFDVTVSATLTAERAE